MDKGKRDWIWDDRPNIDNGEWDHQGWVEATNVKIFMDSVGNLFLNFESERQYRPEIVVSIGKDTQNRVVKEISKYISGMESSGDSADS